MRISDWSSDVCSSDLLQTEEAERPRRFDHRLLPLFPILRNEAAGKRTERHRVLHRVGIEPDQLHRAIAEIGKADPAVRMQDALVYDAWEILGDEIGRAHV